MLDEKDLQAIAQLIKASEDRMDVKLAETKRDVMQSVSALEDRMDVKLAETKRDIMQGVAVLMDEHFEKKFDLLAEGHEMMREKLEPLDELPLLDTRVSALEAAVRKLNRDIAQMKKAQ